MSYILNVIELITNADAFCAGDAVDIEEFIEIMTAYIPEFISANRLIPSYLLLCMLSEYLYFYPDKN